MIYSNSVEINMRKKLKKNSFPKLLSMRLREKKYYMKIRIRM